GTWTGADSAGISLLAQASPRASFHSLGRRTRQGPAPRPDSRPRRPHWPGRTNLRDRTLRAPLPHQDRANAPRLRALPAREARVAAPCPASPGALSVRGHSSVQRWQRPGRASAHSAPALSTRQPAGPAAVLERVLRAAPARLLRLPAGS